MYSSIKSQNTYTKTKYPNWILFAMITILLLIPMVITWIYAGEWNEGHNNWLVANSQFARYWMLNPEKNVYAFSKNLTGLAHISWEPFVIPVLIWLFNLAIYTLTSWLRWTKVNGYNFINGIFLMSWITIISGLWYPTDEGKLNLIISARVLISALSFFVGFIISVFIVNNLIANTSIGSEYGQELINDEIQRQKYIKENIEPNKHDLSKHKKKTSIKVKENSKDKKTK